MHTETHASTDDARCPVCGCAIDPEMTLCPACGFDLTASHGPFEEGAVLESRYRIDVEVGRGGMGVVYRGNDLTLDRPVAIKAVRQADADPQTLARFIREARALASVEHPALVPVYAVGSQEGCYYLVMKFIEGNTLKDLLKRRGCLAVPEVRRILDAICDALGALHRQKLIHRDIKPGNVMIQPDGRVVLMDLGIVKSVDDNTNTTALALGTPKYMAPEMLNGQRLDGRADIYSLAVLVFEMLTGRVPFDGPTPMAIMFKQAHEAPPSLEAEMPQLPKSLSRTVDRALSKDPESRHRTVEVFAEAAHAPEPEPEPEPTRKGLWVALAALLLVGGAGGWWFGFGPGSGDQGGGITEGAGPDAQVSGLAGPGQGGGVDSKTPAPDAGAGDAERPDAMTIELPDAEVKAKADVEPANSTEPVKVAKITISLKSVPRGAEVFEGGRSLGRTPLTVKRRKSSRAVTWRVKRRGYTDKTVKVKLSSNQTLTVKLEEMFELLP